MSLAKQIMIKKQTRVLENRLDHVSIIIFLIYCHFIHYQKFSNHFGKGEAATALFISLSMEPPPAAV